jgi:hypothetical protein|tara:strand:- start:43 stop:543 length:501 start_codon:yes stop_codon:yes gene_type:complete
MKDNFDTYKWKQKELQSTSNVDGKFDLYEWNKKRYLGELDIDQNINKDDEGSSFNITRGGDDAKIGAEEESDANVVGEGLNDRISKIEIGYTDQGRIYGVKIEDASGRRLGKLGSDDFNDLLKMLNINDEIPFKMSFGDEDVLDSIVKQLQDQGIDASWDDIMDVS